MNKNHKVSFVVSVILTKEESLKSLRFFLRQNDRLYYFTLKFCRFSGFSQQTCSITCLNCIFSISII